jgi:hypothetical protein
MVITYVLILLGSDIVTKYTNCVGKCAEQNVRVHSPDFAEDFLPPFAVSRESSGLAALQSATRSSYPKAQLIHLTQNLNQLWSESAKSVSHARLSATRSSDELGE